MVSFPKHFFCTSCQGYCYPRDSTGSCLGQKTAEGSRNVPMSQLFHAALWHVDTNLLSPSTSANNAGVRPVTAEALCTLCSLPSLLQTQQPPAASGTLVWIMQLGFRLLPQVTSI